MTSCPVTYIMFAFLPANAAGTVKLDYVRIYAQMPLTVFDCKGIPATQRERIDPAVEAAGRHGRHLTRGRMPSATP